MSTTIIERQGTRPDAIANGNGTGSTQSWLRPLNLHWAGVALLAAVNLYLLAQMALLWHEAGTHNADAMAQQRIALRAADIAAQPLRGLDTKLGHSTDEADRFYRERLPGADSEVAGELGALTKRNGVRLIRVGYTHAVVLAGSSAELTELKMDASLSGDYRPLMLFINSLERGKMFFLINGVILTGQQSGTVNLRLKLTTYLRGAGTPDANSALSGEGAASAKTTAPAGGPGR